MQGTVIWYHPELRVALIERADGFTVGSVESGDLDLGLLVKGDLRTPGLIRLIAPVTGQVIEFAVEADALTEDQANELLGFVRD
jgi:hypothetical protein